jgi:hypothetical protein
MKVFGAPVSNDLGFLNYKKSVSKELIDSCPIVPEILKINSLWGLKKEKRNTWKKIEKGDVIFFYRNKYFISYSIVIDRIEDSKMANDIWGNAIIKHYSPYTYPLIIVMSKPIDCYISFSRVNEKIGYHQDYFLRSFFELKNLGDYITKNNIGIIDFIKKESEKV